MTQYTQTTTADEQPKYRTAIWELNRNNSQEPIQQPNSPYKFGIWLIVLSAIIIAIIGAFIYGKSQGRSEAETKQAILSTQAKIDTIYIQKEVKATNVRQQSNNASKASKIIREGVIVSAPEHKPTNERDMIIYLKDTLKL